MVGQKKSITLKDKEDTLRKRLYECYSKIPPELYDSFHGIVLRAAVDSFAIDPEKDCERGLLFSKVGDVAPGHPFEFWSRNSLADGMRIDVARSSGAQSWLNDRIPNTEGCSLEELVHHV